MEYVRCRDARCQIPDPMPSSKSGVRILSLRAEPQDGMLKPARWKVLAHARIGYCKSMQAIFPSIRCGWSRYRLTGSGESSRSRSGKT